MTTTTDTRTADQILTDFRRTALRWEANLTKNIAHAESEGSPLSAARAKTQLDLVQDILDQIGRV